MGRISRFGLRGGLDDSPLYFHAIFSRPAWPRRILLDPGDTQPCELTSPVAYGGPRRPYPLGNRLVL